MVRILFILIILIIIGVIIYAAIKIIAQDNTNNKSMKSISDELLKLQNLREEGIITEEEFQRMKNKLLK